MSYRLGKKPARPGAVKLALRTYLDRVVLPTPPAEFGYEALLPADCGMFGNDRFGSCVWAGAAHETMLWNELADRDGGAGLAIGDADVLADYAAVTGFDPSDPSTDLGTDLQAAASYRRKVGIRDQAGRRHKIGAYVALEPRDLEDHKIAAWLFGAAGVGLTIGDRQIEQFERGEPWHGPTGAGAGGHYVSLIGFRRGMLNVVTFGRVHPVTVEFFVEQNDESVAYLAEEMLREGKGPTALELGALEADLRALLLA